MKKVKTQSEQAQQELLDELSTVCKWADQHGHIHAADILKFNWHSLMYIKYMRRKNGKGEKQ